MEPTNQKEMKRYNHLIGEIDATYHEMSLKLGLSDSAMRVLYTICINGVSCPLQEVCRLSGLSKQTVNSAIRGLEKKDIVYLEPKDPKHKNVCLTEQGQMFANHTVLRIIEAENDIFSSWSKENMEKYLDLTEKFLTALQEKAECL